MTEQAISKAIESLKKDTNGDEIKAISALQAAAAKLGNEQLIEQLYVRKMALINN